MNNIVFHVVNSIKGGCGKSTIALLLADHYQDKLINDNNKYVQESYIIDLDWYGTSWLKNYEKYLKKDSNVKYINDLMFDFKEASKSNFIHQLSVTHNDNADLSESDVKDINICIANPENVDLNDVEQDLFENTVYNVIKKIIENSNCEETLHIILDMPPSYEKYSDRVLNHLLLDQTSPLYRDFIYGEFKNNKPDTIEKYEIRLYMISALSIAHIDLNVEFLKNFIKKQSYSSVLSEFNDNGRLKVYFIVNDANNVLSQMQGVTSTNLTDKMRNILQTEKKHYECLQCGTYQYTTMAYNKQISSWITPGSSNMPENILGFNSSTLTNFSDLFKDLGIEPKKDSDSDGDNDEEETVNSQEVRNSLS